MWVTVTVEDVKSRFAIDELEALQTEQVAEGQADPIEEVIAETVQAVRGAVGVRNTLADGESIPVKLKSYALNMIRFEVLNRLGQEISEGRKISYQNAFKVLEKVEQGLFSISEPETPDPDETQGGVTVVSNRDRIATRNKTNGLF